MYVTLVFSYLCVRGRVVGRQLDGRDVQFEPWRLFPLQAAVPAAWLIHARQLPLRLPAARHRQGKWVCGTTLSQNIITDTRWHKKINKKIKGPTVC